VFHTQQQTVTRYGSALLPIAAVFYMEHILSTQCHWTPLKAGLLYQLFSCRDGWKHFRMYQEDMSLYDVVSIVTTLYRLDLSTNHISNPGRENLFSLKIARTGCGATSPLVYYVPGRRSQCSAEALYHIMSSWCAQGLLCFTQ
jgi:hypothetical protein